MLKIASKLTEKEDPNKVTWDKKSSIEFLSKRFKKNQEKRDLEEDDTPWKVDPVSFLSKLSQPEPEQNKNDTPWI